jgi:membrane protease YdiL (CAAX protease family)
MDYVEITMKDTSMLYYPTLRGVNLLYLISLVLVVTIGSVLQARSVGWGLILTELLLILVPALLYLRIARLPLRETVRLRWPGARLAALSLVVGVGFALIAYWWGNWSRCCLVTPFQYPLSSTRPQPGRLCCCSALALAAPVCEEFLFRGVIQRGC